MNKALFFDFFGVICSEIAPFWFERFFSKKTSSQLKEKFVLPADVGDISEREMFMNLGGLVGKTPEEVLSDWLELAIIDKSCCKLLLEMKKLCKIFLLSNAPSEFISRLLDENNLRYIFDETFISSEMKLVKPDIRFFETVLQKVEFAPNSILMIDDNERNLIGAKRVGLNTLHYINFETACPIIKDFIKN